MSYDTIRHVFYNRYDSMSKYFGYPLHVDAAMLINKEILKMESQKYSTDNIDYYNLKRRNSKESKEHLKLKAVGKKR